MRRSKKNVFQNEMRWQISSQPEIEMRGTKKMFSKKNEIEIFCALSSQPEIEMRARKNSKKNMR